MGKRYGQITYNPAASKMPRRGEIWLAVDRYRRHAWDDKDAFADSVQGGTRLCIVVSNDVNNTYLPVVEVVYMTTKNKHDLPTHFMTSQAPEPSTVLCEQIATVSKKALTKYYGTLVQKEKAQLDNALGISLGLHKMGPVRRAAPGTPRRGEIWRVAGGQDLCVIVSNNVGNAYSPVVEVVYMAVKQDPALPTHFAVDKTAKPSVALCERIATIAKKDLAECCGRLTQKERALLDDALKVSLALK